MRGNITRRGKASWRLKFDLGTDPVTGKRLTQFATVRGTKKEAEAELNKRLNQVDEGTLRRALGCHRGRLCPTLDDGHRPGQDSGEDA